MLGLGCRFEEQETNWRAATCPIRAPAYIQVDIDPAEIGRSVVPQLAVVGDVRLVLRDLLEALKPRAQRDRPRRAWMRSRATSSSSRTRSPAWSARAAAGPSDAGDRHGARGVPARRDGGDRCRRAGAEHGRRVSVLQGVRAALLHRPSSFYGMGFASAGLPVAKLVHPDRPAVGFVGDGSFQMIMNVLPTAVEHKLPVTWCVLNDGALGSILDGQVPPSATGSSRPHSDASRISPHRARPASAMASGSTTRAGRRARSSARATQTPRNPGGDRLHRRARAPRRKCRILHPPLREGRCR